MPVVSVTEDQDVDAAGNLVNLYTITYTIPGRPGSFTEQVTKNADALAAATAAIEALTAQVTGIYQIP